MRKVNWIYLSSLMASAVLAGNAEAGFVVFAACTTK